MTDVFADHLAEVEPLKVDQWIVSSLLQKSIRRGDADVAARAALTLFKLKGSALWRRLMVIAFEDIGVGSVNALIATVSSSDAAWRKGHGGDARVAVGLARVLAKAAKDRSADYLICGSKDHPSLIETRQTCASSSIEYRLEAVGSPTLPLAVRAMWAWYASGIEWGNEKRVGKGDLAALLTTFETRGVPAELIAATETAAARTREPITVMAPLIWLAVHDDQNVSIRENTVPSSPIVGDVPLYALDKHTRTGREAIYTFSRNNEEVRACLELYVPPGRRREAAYLAAFYADAAPVSRRLVWDQSEALEAYGIENDLLLAGVPSEGIEPLLAAFRCNLDHLNAVRREVLLRTRPLAGL